jgi:hypothetical protein
MINQKGRECSTNIPPLIGAQIFLAALGCARIVSLLEPPQVPGEESRYFPYATCSD